MDEIANQNRNHPSGAAGYTALPLRLIVGYGLINHGMAKWTRGPTSFAATLHAIGVPMPHLMAWISILTEVLGGAAFLLGAFVFWPAYPPSFCWQLRSSRSIYPMASVPSN